MRILSLICLFTAVLSKDFPPQQRRRCYGTLVRRVINMEVDGQGNPLADGQPVTTLDHGLRVLSKRFGKSPVPAGANDAASTTFGDGDKAISISAGYGLLPNRFGGSIKFDFGRQIHRLLRVRVRGVNPAHSFLLQKNRKRLPLKRGWNKIDDWFNIRRFRLTLRSRAYVTSIEFMECVRGIPPSSTTTTSTTTTAPPRNSTTTTTTRVTPTPGPGLGRPILDSTGNPIGLDTCGVFGDSVDGFPCSPFEVSPFTEVLTSTAEFNPDVQESMGETCRREDGHCADVYNIDIVGVDLDLFQNAVPQCAGRPTKMISFGGTVPAKTLLVTQGREAYVQFNNKITQEATPRPDMYNGPGCDSAVDGKQGVPVSVHNHGQASVAPFDGFATDRMCMGETKAYMFPNNRPTSGWFHDHALHQTTENDLHGLFGFYLISEKTSLGGCGDPYNLDEMEEVQMALNDYVITDQCQILWDFEGPHAEDYYGDINMVNGRPFPTLARMQRKWYRYRILNAATSRPYLLRLLDRDGRDYSSSLCQVIASDGGYLEFGPQPFPTAGLKIAVAERWEFVCDFTQLDPSVTELIMYNDQETDIFADVPTFTYSNFVTKFVFDGETDVNAPVFDPNARGNVGNFVPGTVLQDALPMATQMALNGESHRTFKFDRGNGLWTINGETWDSARVAASDVGQNTWEVWEIDSGGGWFHPVHVHLVDFFVLAHENDAGVLDLDVYGQSGAPKDVVLVEGPRLFVLARFGPHRGEYMLHCHNLVHEDHDMLRTYIIEGNTADNPGGRNAGNLDSEFTEVNGIIYDNYALANPLVGNLLAIPTDIFPPPMERARQFLRANFYRIFYPLPNDQAAVLNNPWRARSEECGQV